MADYQKLGEAFLELAEGEELLPGDLGMTISGVFRVIDPDDPRRFFVRFPNGTFVSALHKNRVLQRPGTPVLVGKDNQGNPVIVGIDPSRANAFYSNSGGGGNDVGLHDHVRNSGREYVTDPWLIKRMRTTVTSGFTVQIDDGAYVYNRILTWWDTDTIDLTAYIPSNPVYDRWVIVGVDPISNTLVAVAGDEYFPDTIFDPSQIDLIAFTQLGYIPCAAVYIRGTNTELVNYQIEDLRFAPGSFIAYLGDLVDVNNAYDSYGYVLTFDGDEWVAHPSSGGGTVQSVVAGDNIEVDSSDPANPVVSTPSRPRLGAATIVTISGGVLDLSAIPSRNIIVAAQSGTADTLDQVIGVEDGDELALQADTGDTITISDNADIHLYGASPLDIVGTDVIKFVGRGSNVIAQYVDQNDGGGLIPSLIYTRWDVNAPPVSPSSDDDEFVGSVSGSWTDFDHGSAMSYAIAPMGKGVKMTFPQLATNVGGLLRAAPVGDFTVLTRVKLISETPSTRLAGLIFAEGTANNSRFYILLISGNTINNVQNVQLHRYTDFDTFAASDFGTNPTTAIWGNSMDIILRVRRISTTYHLDYSFDGESWAKAGTSTMPNITSLTHIGVGGAANNASNGTFYAIFDYFRVYTDTAFDSPAYGRQVGVYEA